MIKKAIRSTFRALGFDIVRFNQPSNPIGNPNRELSHLAKGMSEIKDCCSMMINKAHVGADPPSDLTGPVMLAPKTYNPNHPKYDATLARNFPGCFFNVSCATERTESTRSNEVFQYFLREKTMTLCGPNPTNYDFLADQIRAVACDLENDPDYQNFQIKSKDLEDFIAYLNATYPGDYAPGNVAAEDGMFLYFMVRRLHPRTIVQTGVSNGASCAYMTLALKHNGEGGVLRAVDIPAVYDPDDPGWHLRKPYGVCIPPGRSSGWLVPDGLTSSFDCWNGDAKELLPKLLEEVGSVDMFYHDSDHSYDHMWFEFNTVLPYMVKHGIIIADDIAWNSSTVDFAEHIGCYAMNHRGSQGVIFL